MMELTQLSQWIKASGGEPDVALTQRLEQDGVPYQPSVLDEILDTPGVIEETFLRNLAQACQLRWVDEAVLRTTEESLTAIPVRTALKYQMVPLRTTEGCLIVAIYNPWDLVARQQIGKLVQGDYELVMSTRSRVRNAIREGYGIGADTLEAVIEGRAGEAVFDQLREEANKLDEDGDDEASVITFVNRILREAILEGATDIHVEPLEDDLRIRFRLDGVLHAVPVPPSIRQLQESVITRLKIMARLDIAERRLPQDGRINLEMEGKRIDVRVATIPTVTGETVSLRLLSGGKYDFQGLGVDHDEEALLRELLESPNGIILVTGPTGSGKSTTLYTLLSCLNKPGTRIVTIEDPVENKMAGINQIAVRPEVGLTFAVGLRSVLRADPNVVMVGEMRDVETTETAIRAALTGHLVFSTLHTNDAISSITRLVDMGIEPFLVSASVRAFIAQRLVRRLCPHCKQIQEYSREELRRLGFESDRPQSFHGAVGCPSCRDTGYAGRMAIMEICRVTTAMQDLIAKRADEGDLRRQAVHEGMKLLRQNGMEKVRAGLTSVEEIHRVTVMDQLTMAESN
jgi:general secretion pathway protein E